MMIADIGGYTRFMKLHRMSLAHSHVITGRLLKAVVKAVPDLRLIEIEGDAAFFFLPDTGEQRRSVTDLSLAMHQAFHREQQQMVARNLCACDACHQAGELKLKFVAHVGEGAMQKIQRQSQLVGVDVIAIHRMLKNSVPVDEYVLMSEAVYERCPPELREQVRTVEEHLEGLDETTLYFLDLEPLVPEAGPPPRASLPRRLGETLGVVFRGLPAMVRSRSTSSG